MKPVGTGCGRPSGREDGGHGERAAECVRGAASAELRDSAPGGKLWRPRPPRTALGGGGVESPVGVLEASVSCRAPELLGGGRRPP